MAEWHVTPDYIVKHWTDELLYLMTEKLMERKERKPTASEKPRVSEEMFFAQASGMIKREAR